MKFNNAIFSALHAPGSTFIGNSACRYHLALEDIDDRPSLTLRVPISIWTAVTPRLTDHIHRSLAHERTWLPEPSSGPLNELNALYGTKSAWSLEFEDQTIRLSTPLYTPEDSEMYWKMASLRWILDVLNAMPPENRKVSGLPKHQLLTARLTFSSQSADPYQLFVALAPKVVSVLKKADEDTFARTLTAKLDRLASTLVAHSYTGCRVSFSQNGNIILRPDTMGVDIGGSWREHYDSGKPGVLLLGHNVATPFLQGLLLFGTFEILNLLNLL